MIKSEFDLIRKYQYHKQFNYELDSRIEDITFFDIVKKNIGLHSTDYWTPYLSTYARIGKFESKKMFQSINTGNQLLRINAFRKTVFLIHKDNFPLIIDALGPYLEKFYLNHPEFKKEADHSSLDFIPELLILLDKPKFLREIKSLTKIDPSIIKPLIRVAMSRGQIVRATAKHARSNLTSYINLNHWISGIELGKLSHENAFNQLILQYIERFGPVTLEDIAWWLGVPKIPVRRGLEHLLDNILTFKVENKLYYLSKADYEIFQSDINFQLPEVVFLPYEDHFPKGYLRREWFLQPDLTEKLFPLSPKNYWPGLKSSFVTKVGKSMNQKGEIRPSIWINGKILGRWEINKDNGIYEVVMSIYADMSTETYEKVIEIKEELQKFINDDLAKIS